jgi:hypothetical protein
LNIIVVTKYDLSIMKLILQSIFGATIVLTSGWLYAQTYTCRDNTGRVYQSSRACPSPGLIYYGPTERPNSGGSTFIPSVGQAPDHIEYMSPRCASLHDAMRTAPARGIKQPEMADMRREYSRDCAEDEGLARQKLLELRAGKRNEAKAAEQAKQLAAQQSKMSAEMCGELKRVIKNKKMRTDLTPGEIADLERSEQNYKGRCT